MALNFALVGNPNSGKTTLFNNLTKSRAHVGNWPGVTVERKEGLYKKNDTKINIIDLPGIYSLSPYSEEEVIARDYIFTDKPDLIINIVDATNLERNLYLTTQLMETGIKVIIALNMMDELKANGDTIDHAAIEKRMGIPIVPISASKNTGIDLLMERAIAESNKKENSAKTILENSVAYPHIKNIHSVIKDKYPDESFFTAVKLLEKDEKMKASFIGKNEVLYKKVNELSDNALKELISEKKTAFTEWDIIIADARYSFIGDAVKANMKKTLAYGELTMSDKIDKIATHRVLAIPLFLFVMFIVFQITFGPFGTFFADTMDVLVHETFSGFINDTLVNAGASEWAVSLVVDGIIPGVGMILVFLPQILLLFLFLSILEDSGYMARAAFIMDRLLRRFGLSGKSFVPMLMGFGCSVPAIMAARTMDNERDRKMTIILTPFMSCGARLPVYAVFAGALFAKNASIVIFSIYILGIVVAVFAGIILKNTVLRGATPTFIMELPTYRFPTISNLFMHLWEKAKGFIQRAGTILMAASIVIWVLNTFNFSFQMVSEPSESIFGAIGTAIAPLFAPLGFGDWRASVALLTGFIAKEIVVSTLGILYGAGDVTELTDGLASSLQLYFTPLSAYAYMAFVLLYMPCVVAFSAIKREMVSWKWTIFTVLFQTTVAWTVAFLIFQIGSLLGFK